MQFVPSFVQAQILNYLNDSEYNAILKSVSVDDICRAWHNTKKLCLIVICSLHKSQMDRKYVNLLC